MLFFSRAAQVTEFKQNGWLCIFTDDMEIPEFYAPVNGAEPACDLVIDKPCEIIVLRVVIVRRMPARMRIFSAVKMNADKSIGMVCIADGGSFRRIRTYRCSG